MNRIVICAALPDEVRFLRRWLRDGIRSIDKKLSIEILVSGVGRERMKRTLDSTPYDSVSCWLSVGYSGALIPDLKVGDCLQGSTILTANGARIQPECPAIHSFQESRRALLCSDIILSTPTQKHQYHEKTSADVVDMESAAVAEHALARGEAFAWIRIVSDTVEELLPLELTHCVNQDGFPSPLAGIRTLLGAPRLLPVMLRMAARNTRLGKSLARAILETLEGFEAPK